MPSSPALAASPCRDRTCTPKCTCIASTPAKQQVVCCNSVHLQYRPLPAGRLGHILAKISLLPAFSSLCEDDIYHLSHGRVASVQQHMKVKPTANVWQAAYYCLPPEPWQQRLAGSASASQHAISTGPDWTLWTLDWTSHAPQRALPASELKKGGFH